MIIDLESIHSFHQIGLRETQEDARFPDSDNPETDCATFIVCDGVGGCDKGEVASSTVCSTIGNIFSSHKNTDSFTENDFALALSQAYQNLEIITDETNKEMGTTLTFIAFHSKGVFAAHIGDSRIYQIRPGEGIIYRSEDHSLVNALLRSGNLSPDEIKDHPKSNVITRCISPKSNTEDRAEATIVNLTDINPGDYFLLCSDGVTEKFDEEELIQLFSSDLTDEEKYQELSSRCADSSDNNTAIQIHVGIISVDSDSDDDENDDISEVTVNTQKIRKKEESVHDLPAAHPRNQSKLKSFISRLFG